MDDLDDLDLVLTALQKKPFDRNSQDVAALVPWLQHRRGFFESMPQAVLQMLCSLAGATVVDEGCHVFQQGHIGDCMYVCLRGYCSVSKFPAQQLQDQHTASTTVSSSTCSSNQPSRRTTLEQQVHQFALATAAVAPTGSSRRGTAEEQQHLLPAAAAAAVAVGLCSSAGVAGSRRTTSEALAAGVGGSCRSRRATSELLEQQRLAEAVHVGWVSEGDSIGEAALISPGKPRPVSVMAGDGGLRLLQLDRAAFNRLQMQAQADPSSGAAVTLHALLAACCRPLLATPPGKRSAEQIDTLSELLAGLEAFKRLSPTVRLRLASSVQSVTLPAGAVVFEEDTLGDAMYVVLSGRCQVRARPLQTDAPAADPQETELTQLAQKQQQQQQDKPAVRPADSSSSGGGGSKGAGVAAASGPRRTTWEGAAFTAQEQARLEAVRAALDADKQQQPQPSHAEVSSVPAGSRDGGVEKDGLYWTAQFMSQALSSATAADPHWGLAGGMTPLAAVFAAKWRQQMRKQQAGRQAAQAALDERTEADRAYAAMKEMLGKAAAKAWKAARDGAAADPAAAQPGAAGAMFGSGDGAAAANFSRTQSNIAGSVSGSSSNGGADVNAAQLSKLQLRDLCRTGGTSINGSSNGSSVAAATAGSSASSGPCSIASTPRSSAAGAAVPTVEQLLSAAAAAADPAASLKLQLAAVGVRDPAEVSRRLMEEVVARADLGGLLASVAAILEARGLPRRLNRHGSLKITRELNRRMLAGASWKGYSSSSNGRGRKPSAAEPGQQEAEQQAAAVGPVGPASPGSPRCLNVPVVGFAGVPQSAGMDEPVVGRAAGRRARGGLSGRASDEGGGDGELTAEATSMSVAWEGHSSIDCSEAASLCMSLEAEGSSLLGSVEAAARAADSKSSSSCKPCWGLATDASKAAAAASGGGGVVGGARGVNGVAPQQWEEVYGPLIRVLGPGQSFGEVALLQKAATRTATVVVEPAPAEEAALAGEAATAATLSAEAGVGAASSSSAARDCGELATAGPGQRDASSVAAGCVFGVPAAGAVAAAAGGGGGEASGVELIRVSRSCYDATVRAVQVAALEDLLAFLSGLAPFAGLSRGDLTSLAVFVRPVAVEPGQLVALAGARVEELLLVQEGEVKLVDSPAAALTGGSSSSSWSGNVSGSSPHQSGGNPTSSDTLNTSGSSAAAAGLTESSSAIARGSQPLPRSRRATADAIAAASSSAAAQGPAASTSGSRRVLIRQLSNPSAAAAAALRQPHFSGATRLAAPDLGSSGGGGGGFNSAVFAGPADAQGSALWGAGGRVSALALGRVCAAAAPLAVLGPGGLLGENVLGLDPDQDPLQAIAAAKTRRARAAALAAAEGLVHGATAVAVRPCRLLLLPAADLRRFGRRVRGPLVQLALERREFLQGRRSAVKETKSSLAQMMADVKQQLQAGAVAQQQQQQQQTPMGSSSSHSMLPGFRPAASSQQQQSAGTTVTPAGSVLLSSGSTAAVRFAAAAGSGAGGAVGISRSAGSEWQQRQWQQEAFGELFNSQHAAAGHPQQQQQMCIADVARLKQLVPGMSVPCVSELAAAARPFPDSLLNATAFSADGFVAQPDRLLSSSRQGSAAAGDSTSTSLGSLGGDTVLHSSCLLRDVAAASQPAGLKSMVVQGGRQQLEEGQQGQAAAPASCPRQLLSVSSSISKVAAAAVAGEGCSSGWTVGPGGRVTPTQ